MLHIGDKVTIRGWGNHIYTIVQISNDDSTIKYRGFDWEYTVPSDLHKESEMTVVEPTSEPNTITVGDDVLVSKYSDIRMMQESSGAYRTHEGLVEPETPVHGVVTTVNGSAYQTYCVRYRVQLDDGNSVKVDSQDITRAADYTLF